MAIEIVVVPGHYPGLYALQRPVWQGELDEFVAANEGLDEALIAAQLAPDQDGFVQIGGGAEPEFSIYERSAREKLIEAIYDNFDDGDSRCGAGW